MRRRFKPRMGAAASWRLASSSLMGAAKCTVHPSPSVTSRRATSSDSTSTTSVKVVFARAAADSSSTRTPDLEMPVRIRGMPFNYWMLMVPRRSR